MEVLWYIGTQRRFYEIRETHRRFRNDAADREAISFVQPRGRKELGSRVGLRQRRVMGTTELSENYVFLTTRHDHASTEAIWVAKSYQPESGRVQFYKIEPGDKVGVISVQCSEKGRERTQVEVSYEYIAIAEKGERFVESFDEKAHADFASANGKRFYKSISNNQKQGSLSSPPILAKTNRYIGSMKSASTARFRMLTQPIEKLPLMSSPREGEKSWPSRLRQRGNDRRFPRTTCS